MSTFTGTEIARVGDLPGFGGGKGAMRRHRELKRMEAAERREDFERDVARVAREQNITEREARPVAAASRRLRREVERRRSA